MSQNSKGVETLKGLSGADTIITIIRCAPNHQNIRQILSSWLKSHLLVVLSVKSSTFDVLTTQTFINEKFPGDKTLLKKKKN